MKILIVSSLFPPDVLGGAEIVASNLAQWLVKHGHEVCVLTTAKTPDEALWGEKKDGMKIWKIFMPRPYSILKYANARKHQKILWHLQDHFAPFNKKIIDQILTEEKPDLINLHNIQGIGYNILNTIAEKDFPTVLTLHDFSLACIRTSMFKNGKNCEKQELPCKLSSWLKCKSLNKIKRLSFWAPSEGMLKRIEKFVPVKKQMCRVIKYPVSFAQPTAKKTDSNLPRFLYVGRLADTKGVNFLLECLKKLSSKHRFQMTLVGGGPLEQELRAQYALENWCAFTGFIPNEQVANHMINADLLCVPSLWPEPLGLVTLQALTLGLPVFASNTCGSPELIEHEKNGLLLSTGDSQAWLTALENLLSHPESLLPLKQYALDTRHRFDQDLLANQLLNLFHSTI